MTSTAAGIATRIRAPRSERRRRVRLGRDRAFWLGRRRAPRWSVPGERRGADGRRAPARIWSPVRGPWASGRRRGDGISASPETAPARGELGQALLEGVAREVGP